MRELYLYSGNRCAYDPCEATLLLDSGTWDCNVAHIYGVKEDAARGDHTLSDEELRDVSNLMLTCQKHHKEIDNKALEGKYTVDVVRAMKAEHEGKYKEALVKLDRIVDTSVSAPGPKRAHNFKKFDEYVGAEEVEYLSEAWGKIIGKVARQPIPARDLLVMILDHGEYRHGGMEVKITQIEGVAAGGADMIKRWALHLEDDGLIYIEADEQPAYFSVPDSEQLFKRLCEMAQDDRTILSKVLVDLDLTVLDDP